MQTQTFDINRFKDDRIARRADGLFEAKGFPNAYPTYGECLKALRAAEHNAQNHYGDREPK